MRFESESEEGYLTLLKQTSLVGYDGSYRSDFHAFHFPTGVWRQVLGHGDLPRARYRGTCVVCIRYHSHLLRHA